ncbi:MAG: hypothetical protein LBG05_08610 [Treponema sp.]|jgi:predicted transcriptional regulator|nr:hypothetical protein [Treponema sp.]
MAELKWYMGDNADRVNASLDELKRWYADDNVGRVNASLDELKRWYADDNVGQFYKRLDQLETEMRKRETRTEERITQALGEIKELYRGLLMSRSWRIGRAITWLPRKIKDLFRHT